MLKNKICAAILIFGGLGVECLAQEGDGKTPQPSAGRVERSQGESIRQERLKRLMSAVGVNIDGNLTAVQGSRHKQVRIVWEADPAAREKLSAVETSTLEARRDSFGHSLRVADVRESAGTLPRHRSPELSQDKLMVIAVGAGGNLKWWTLIDDPRLVRAEVPGPDGVLSGQTFYRAEPEFVVNVPEDKAITELRLYHPRWTGREFVLDLINTISIQ
jgi:hypothetical protein